MEICYRELMAVVSGGVVGLVSALAGAWYSVMWQARKAAKVRFAEDLLRELEGMYPNSNAWPSDSRRLIAGRIPRLQSAVFQLAIHIPNNQRAKLQRAWEEFQVHCNALDDQAINAQALYGRDGNEDQVVAFRRYVDALMRFAE